MLKINIIGQRVQLGWLKEPDSFHKLFFKLEIINPPKRVDTSRVRKAIYTRQ